MLTLLAIAVETNLYFSFEFMPHLKVRYDILGNSYLNIDREYEQDKNSK